MQNWVDLYKELCNKVSLEIPMAEWIDLWHNQINFLETEHSFPSPAVFLSFRIVGTEDLGTLVQKVKLQVDFYVFYETFSDTYKGSWNQDTALSFLNILSDVYNKFHGTSGMNYSGMRRIGMSAVDTGSAGNLYVTNFECLLMDYGAQKQYSDANIPEDIIIQNGGAPAAEIDTEPSYILPI